MSELPRTACFRHVGAQDGFEVVFIRREAGGFCLEGHSTGIEAGVAWSVGYRLTVDAGWRTRAAHVTSDSLLGHRELTVAGDGAGNWVIDGRPAPDLAGLLDVDLEASAVTNLLPVRRLALAVGQASAAPAAYVRAPGLEIERLEQRYERIADGEDGPRYAYSAPRFDYEATLRYDRAGLVLDYPELAVRAA